MTDKPKVLTQLGKLLYPDPPEVEESEEDEDES